MDILSSQRNENLYAIYVFGGKPRHSSAIFRKKLNY